MLESQERTEGRINENGHISLNFLTMLEPRESQNETMRRQHFEGILRIRMAV